MIYSYLQLAAGLDGDLDGDLQLPRRTMPTATAGPSAVVSRPNTGTGASKRNNASHRGGRSAQLHGGPGQNAPTAGTAVATWRRAFLGSGRGAPRSPGASSTSRAALVASGGRVQSDCCFRKRGTQSLSKFGMKRMDGSTNDNPTEPHLQIAHRLGVLAGVHLPRAAAGHRHVARRHLLRQADLHLGFGRIVVSETEAPNLFVNLVRSG